MPRESRFRAGFGDGRAESRQHRPNSADSGPNLAGTGSNLVDVGPNWPRLVEVGPNWSTSAEDQSMVAGAVADFAPWEPRVVAAGWEPRCAKAHSPASNPTSGSKPLFLPTFNIGRIRPRLVGQTRPKLGNNAQIQLIPAQFDRAWSNSDETWVTSGGGHETWEGYGVCFRCHLHVGPINRFGPR